MADLYNFPVKNQRQAQAVTKPSFDINQPEYLEKLYVDFTAVRSPQQFMELKQCLGIDLDNMQLDPIGDYSKIIFSGHRGCGKTTELIRFSKEMHHPDRYYCVFIALEEKIDIYRMDPEDLFFIIIAALVQQLHADKIDFAADLMKIAKEWVSNTEISEEISKETGIKIEAKAEFGMKFFEWLANSANVNASYGQNNKMTEKIRQDVKLNQKRLVIKLNEALQSLTTKIKQQNKGKDILFIIDGSEKMPIAIYEQLFINDPTLILDMNVQVMISVPIKTYYDIKDRNAVELFQYTYLPMIRLNENSRPLLQQCIQQRVHTDLYEPEALNHLIEYSGGCLRQLLLLFNKASIQALNKKISLAIAEETVEKYATERWIALTAAHQKIINEQDFNNANTEVLELLYSLNIFEYNGKERDRKVNPVITLYQNRMKK